MAVFDFPASPALDDTYTPSGGPTYTWDGVAWRGVSQGAPVTVYVSDTAPSNPAVGQLWWNSATGTMAIWYADSDSAQWVQVSGTVSGLVVTTVISTPGAGVYVPPAGLVNLRVTIVGGGAGGTGASATGASQSSAGGGGGGGGTCIKLYKASDLAASEPYVVAAAVGAPGGSGAAGEDTTFKGMTANGGGAPGAIGSGGAVAGNTVVGAQGGVGGAASGGDLNLPGGRGGNGVRQTHGGANAMPGTGGGTWLAQPQGHPNTLTGTTTSGITGIFPGGGGRGGGNGASQSMASGAGGAAGCIIFEEFF